MRMMTLAACAALAAGTAVAGPALAQSPATGSMEKSGMQGSPNAAGFGKGDAAGQPAKDDTPSAKNLKGPPNANGYEKK